MGLANHSRGGDQWGASYGRSGSIGAGHTSITTRQEPRGTGSVDASLRGWGTTSDSHKGESGHKSVHL